MLFYSSNVPVTGLVHIAYLDNLLLFKICRSNVYSEFHAAILNRFNYILAAGSHKFSASYARTVIA